MVKSVFSPNTRQMISLNPLDALISNAPFSFSAEFGCGAAPGRGHQSQDFGVPVN